MADITLTKGNKITIYHSNNFIDDIHPINHPITGDLVNTNSITAWKNIFHSNYAYQSHLYTRTTVFQSLD